MKHDITEAEVTITATMAVTADAATILLGGGGANSWNLRNPYCYCHSVLMDVESYS